MKALRMVLIPIVIAASACSDVTGPESVTPEVNDRSASLGVGSSSTITFIDSVVQSVWAFMPAGLISWTMGTSTVTVTCHKVGSAVLHVESVRRDTLYHDTFDVTCHDQGGGN